MPGSKERGGRVDAGACCSRRARACGRTPRIDKSTGKSCCAFFPCRSIRINYAGRGGKGLEPGRSFLVRTRPTHKAAVCVVLLEKRGRGRPMIRPCPAGFCIKKGCQTTKKKETNRIRPQLFIFFFCLSFGADEKSKRARHAGASCEGVCLFFSPKSRAANRCALHGTHIRAQPQAKRGRYVKKNSRNTPGKNVDSAVASR